LKPTVRLTAALAVTVTISLLWAGLGGSHRPKAGSVSGSDAALPAAPAPALTIGRPEPLRSSSFLSRWTSLRTTALARVRPAAGARVVADLRPTTPEGTANVLAVLRAGPDAAGALWVKVRLPVLPNGRVGWVRREVLGAYQTANTHFVVDRRTLRATLYRNGKAVFTAPVGVGTASWPTPAGEFLVRSELSRYASPFYGPIAFGTSARSAVLTDWPAGGFIGIHGTSEPQLLPGRVSHGCIRMRNPDILRLAELMPVGTPLTIQ
jgi:lipoprotein-anchoring transpeptidase ErfK/SrfK